MTTAQEAIEFFDRQLRTARKNGDRDSEGEALRELASAYLIVPDGARRAVEYFTQWLKFAREFGDRAGEGAALRGIALALDDLNEGEQAIANAQSALNIFEEIKDTNSAAHLRGLLEAWRMPSKDADSEAVAKKIYEAWKERESKNWS